MPRECEMGFTVNPITKYPLN